jgi:hypothetical protein
MTLPRFCPADLPHEATSRYRNSRIYTPPDPVIVAAFLTIVAKFSKKYDICIVAFCLMGSHDHLLPMDRHRDRPSRVPLFRQQVHAVMGKFLQSYWDLPDDPVYCRKVAAQLFPILDLDRLMEKIAYIELNPLEAGLVAAIEELPVGTVSTREMMFDPIVVERPKQWFRANRWDAEAEIKLEVPEWYLEREGLTLQEFYKRSKEEVTLRKHELMEERYREGRMDFIGLEALQAETPYEPRKDERSTKIVLFTGNDEQINARHYVRYRRFLRSYGRAKERVRDGHHDTVFPYGTNKFAVSYGFEMYVPPG